MLKTGTLSWPWRFVWTAPGNAKSGSAWNSSKVLGPGCLISGGQLTFALTSAEESGGMVVALETVAKGSSTSSRQVKSSIAARLGGVLLDWLWKCGLSCWPWNET